MYRKTYIEVNLDNINYNVKNIIKKFNDYKYYIAMVKANAYGHGLYVINEMIEAGINYFAVSTLEEAMTIRKYNKDIPIICTEIIDLDCIEIAIKNKITLTIHDIDYLKQIVKYKDKIIVHIKIDTGMHRLGIETTKEFNEAFDIIKKNKQIYLEGLYTHFATPGVTDNFFDHQIKEFRKITKDIDLEEIPIIHMSSSFITLSHPKIDICNGIRVGTILYGYDISLKSMNNNPKNILRKVRNNYLIKKNNISECIYDNCINLKKCFSLKTNIMQIKHLKKGDKVGYRLLYTAPKDTYIATLPIGYDDGIGTHHENRQVSINNKKYNIVGEISMCMINVEVDKSVKLSDEVTIIGDGITIYSISSRMNTTFHNTLINIGKNLPRVYIKNNKKVHEESFFKEV